MMKALIITEGGRKIGLGHLTRCISIYQAFKNEGISPVFIVNGGQTVKNVLSGYDHHIFNWLKDRSRMLNIAKHSDIAIIDSYLANAGIYAEIANSVKTVVCIDDNMRIKYPKGIVVNGAVFAELMKYPKCGGIEYLLGSRYVPLRKEFWDVPAKRINDNIASIMVAFGGADGKNMTPEILSFLNSRYPDVIKNVIIGAGFTNVRKIEQLKSKKVNLVYRPDAVKMRTIMLVSDIAISAAGQTLYELAVTGLPTVAVCVADNQKRNLGGWRKSGFIEYAGWHDDKMLFKKLRAAIDKIHDYKSRLAKNNIGRSLVDGKGAGRIAQYLIKRRANENG